MQAVPHRLRQAGAGVEKHAQSGEQILAQRGVGLHRFGNHLEAGGHVEVDGGGNLAQVAQGLANGPGGGFAVVDVERAAVLQRDTDVVVAAECVVPGQPVDQHGRRFGQHRQRQRDLLQVGAPHTLGVDDRFGQLGGAAGEQELDDGAGARGVHGGINLVGGRRGAQVGKGGGGAAVDVALVQHHFHAVVQGGLQRLAEACAVGGIDQARRQRADHVAQFVVVLAGGGIGGRNGAVGHTGVEAAQRHEGVFQAVLAEEDHWALGAQAPVQQGLADAACGLQCLAVAHMLPVTRATTRQRCTARHKAVVGGGFGPVHQEVGDTPGIGTQRQVGLQVTCTVGTLTQVDAGDTKVHGSVARCLGRCGGCLGHFYSLATGDGDQLFCTLAARPSRKSRTRSLASGALWAMPAISASVKKPWSAGCSAIRGRACIRA